MFRALRKRLARILGRESDGDSDDDDGAFAGSVLDWSTNYAHGSSDGEGARELAALREKAETLEDQDRRRQ
ncbi:hypothetical protein [Haloarcula salina]|uniref:Uncharacterized protein n=1 Tax=Haloarcula salina TaxID=1429914 RepID=A0AA41FZ72_9EURY|nr:hypothetical protein [Haloarcula salina]MBV0900614.1 hypothetical protein [Haloarcula salina]